MAFNIDSRSVDYKHANYVARSRSEIVFEINSKSIGFQQMEHDFRVG